MFRFRPFTSSSLRLDLSQSPSLPTCFATFSHFHFRSVCRLAHLIHVIFVTPERSNRDQRQSTDKEEEKRRRENTNRENMARVCVRLVFIILNRVHSPAQAQTTILDVRRLNLFVSLRLYSICLMSAACVYVCECAKHMCVNSTAGRGLLTAKNLHILTTQTCIHPASSA